MAPSEESFGTYSPRDAELEAIIHEFESAMFQGRRPSIRDYLPSSPPDRRMFVLRELAIVSLELRLRSGELADPFEHLREFPELDTPEIREELNATARRFARIEALVPGSRLGHYLLQGELGRGGFGVVFRAIDERCGEVVAVKVLKSRDPRDIRRFDRERRLGSLEPHPSIVRQRDFGEAAGYLYIVSDFIDGDTLRSRLRQGGMTPREAAALISELALGLAHAHSAGVIHRDVKPANVMIDRGGRPLLLDFGLARRDRDDEMLTTTNKAVGTPCYESPEQTLADRGIDGRSDIFSLGVVLYQCLTGRLPFEGGRLSVEEKIRSVDPRPPRKVHSSLPLDLETICLKCLEKDRADRFASATELAGDLQRFLKGEPIVARPPSRVRKASHWCRRNRRRAIYAGVLTCSALTALVAVKVSIKAEDRARQLEFQRKLGSLSPSTPARNQPPLGLTPNQGPELPGAPPPQAPVSADIPRSAGGNPGAAPRHSKADLLKQREMELAALELRGDDSLLKQAELQAEIGWLKREIKGWTDAYPHLKKAEELLRIETSRGGVPARHLNSARIRNNNRLALYWEQAGDWTQAEEYLQLSYRLAQTNTLDLDRARTWNAIGRFRKEQGRIDDARSWHEAAASIPTPLDSPEVREVHAATRLSIGNCRAEYADWLGALIDYNAARFLIQSDLSNAPDQTPLLSLRGKANENAAAIFVKLGVREYVSLFYDRASADFQDTFGLEPDSILAERDLAHCLDGYARFEHETGDPRAALQLYAESSRRLRGLLNKCSTDSLLHKEYARSLYAQGLLLLKLRQIKPAADAFQDSRKAWNFVRPVDLAGTHYLDQWLSCDQELVEILTKSGAPRPEILMVFREMDAILDRFPDNLPPERQLLRERVREWIKHLGA